MVTKWKKKRHMASRGAGDIHRGFWRRILSVVALLEVLEFDGRIILKWAIMKWNWARIGERKVLSGNESAISIT